MGKNTSYNQIVKSTGIFGGAQVIGIIIGFIRSKIIAILLGATGIGLIGIYQSIVDMVRSVATLGIDTGGIREVAAVNSLNDKKSLEEIVAVIKWWVTFTACLGAAILLIFCYPISIWAFESGAYALPVALLSICVFFSIKNLGQTILLQGTRQITSFVKANIYSNIISLVVSIPIYFIFGLKGVFIALIASSIIIFIITLFFTRKLNLSEIKIPASVSWQKGKKILKLGVFVVLGGIMGSVTMFIIRSFLVKNIDLAAAGLFQAVWAITNIYLMLILRSMGADFYPRLCSIINKHVATRRLVNEQTYIVLVIAAPIIVGMILFSKITLIVLYSSDFVASTDLLQWQILGTFFKVISWPMGFILLAKAKGPLYLFSEIFFFVCYLAGMYMLFPYWGLNAAGIAYLIAYIIYLICMFFMSYRLCRFKWRKDILVSFAVSFCTITLSFIFMQKASGLIAYITVGILFIITSLYSLFQLNKVINIRYLINKFFSLF